MQYVQNLGNAVVARNVDFDYRPRIAVVGSRGFLPYWKVPLVLHAMIGDEGAIIVSGGAVGVDTAAKHAAEVMGLGYVEFLPKYISYGRQAPLYRNIEIAEYCHRMVAFWDGKSKGTQHTLATCSALGKPFEIVRE